MFFIQAAAIATSLSIDAFAASFAYGSNQIKIPMRSIQTITLISSAITGLSLLAGSLLQPLIPSWLTVGISFTILFLLGIVKLLDSIVKSLVSKCCSYNREVRFSRDNICFILQLYITPEKADIDNSKILSPNEAASLAIALSLDGIAVGFGAALAGIGAWTVFLYSIITNQLALFLGIHLGNRIARKTPYNLSWLGGGVLILLAFLKLF